MVEVQVLLPLTEYVRYGNLMRRRFGSIIVGDRIVIPF
jgi:hypothetical protein